MSTDPALTAALAALHSYFIGTDTLKATLQRVSEVTTEAVEVADYVGLTLMTNGKPSTAIYTDEISPDVDEAQYRTNNGPCLDAFRTNAIVSLPSMMSGPYEAFREACRTRGIGSTLSLPLTLGSTAVGAMNLYSRKTRGFSHDDVTRASLFANNAAIVLANATILREAHSLNEGLSDAMEHRSIIEQAKGIIMGTMRCSAELAIDQLVKQSQHENIKVRDVAQGIVDQATRPR
jgi:transcriptional regulator with GAF, ATPase, and Fis domain